jgi:hypothetical protein
MEAKMMDVIFLNTCDPQWQINAFVKDKSFPRAFCANRSFFNATIRAYTANESIQIPTSLYSLCGLFETQAVLSEHALDKVTVPQNAFVSDAADVFFA